MDIFLSDSISILELAGGTSDAHLGADNHIRTVHNSFTRLNDLIARTGDLTDRVAFEYENSYADGEASLTGSIEVTDHDLDALLDLVEISGCEIEYIEGDSVSKYVRYKAEELGWDIY